MSDIFEELSGGRADEDPLSSTPFAAIHGGVLVVGEVAPTGQSLHAEERVYLLTSSTPQVLFESVDSDTGETAFENELEFRRAMDSLAPVTVDAALAWCGERIGTVFDAHRSELEAAYFAALEAVGPARQAPGADAVRPRARMPHTTGREGRGRK